MHQPDLMLAMLARLWRSISVAAERRGRARRQPFVWEAPQDNVLDPAQRAELALRWLVAVLVDDVVVGQDQPHLRLGLRGDTLTRIVQGLTFASSAAPALATRSI